MICLKKHWKLLIAIMIIEVLLCSVNDLHMNELYAGSYKLYKGKRGLHDKLYIG